MGPIQEDLSSQRQMRFHIAGGPPVLHIFKSRGESTHHVCLKALAYAFWREYGPLTFDPSTDYKINPHVACLDLTGEVRLWVHCGPWALDKLEYVLRHTDAGDVCWVMEGPEGADQEALSDACAQWVSRIKRQVHYRDTNKKLKLLVFAPLDAWFEPENVSLPETVYVYHAF